MKYAKYVFLVLTVVILAACNNGISASGQNTGGFFNLLDLDGDGVPDVDQRPLIHAYFQEVHSATVQRRPSVLPMLASNSLIACRQDDPNNCQPPVYKETVHVNISGQGSASTNDNVVRPLYLQSLSVDFTFEVEGSRRCLDQAIDAIARKASLKIVGLGTVYDAYANSGGGSVGGGSGGTIDGTVSRLTTIGEPLPPVEEPPTDRPIWIGYQYALFDALRECEAGASLPPIDPIDPIDPLPPVQPQPTPDRAD